MKCLILTEYFPPDPGGEPEYIYNFSKCISGDVTVLTYKYKYRAGISLGSDYKYLDKFRIKKVKFFTFFPTLSHFFRLIDALILLKRGHFDIIICNSVFSGYLGLFLKKLFGINYILIAHGWEVATRCGIGAKFNKAIRGASRIIAVSDFTRREVLKQHRDASITIIPPAFNEEIYKRDVDREFKKKLGLENKKIILTVSRLMGPFMQKGHDIVITALPEIIGSHPDVVYLIVGDGPGRKYLQTLVKDFNLTGKVFFYDYDKSKIHNFYNSCDIFIMPSRNTDTGCEGFGIVYLEAALFAKPSIGGKSGGVSDAILDGITGILVNPINMAEITAAVSKLLDDPEYAKKMGWHARERAWRDFSPQKIAVKINGLLKDGFI